MTKRNAKFDDTQINHGALEHDGKRVAAQLQKMRDYEATAYEKAGHELRKMDDFRISLSQTLAEVKAKCSDRGFKAFQQKWCPNLQRSRIYELLRVGRGVLTLDEARAEAAKRKRQQRQRDHKSSVTVTDKELKAAGFVAKSACDFDHENDAEQPEDTTEVIRRRAALWQSNEAVRLAVENKMHDADSSEIDGEILSAARAAARAWAGFVAKLEQPEASADKSAVEKRIRKDGKAYKLPAKSKAARSAAADDDTLSEDAERGIFMFGSNQAIQMAEDTVADLDGKLFSKPMVQELRRAAVATVAAWDKVVAKLDSMEK
jgi:hypothetical protein